MKIIIKAILLIILSKNYILAQPIHFQRFIINDSLINKGNGKFITELEVAGRQIDIRINHFPEDTNLYQYQLKGIDKDWYDYQRQSHAYFHNIPGGSYSFTIRKKNNHKTFQVVKINIRPNVWQKWWFLPSIYASILLIIGSAFYFVFLYRLRQAVQMRQVRNHIAADLHDEIGATLSGIGILSSLAQKNLDENHPSYGLLGRINDDALSIGNTMDDIVWSINPKNDDLENILARMSRYAAELFDAKDIDYQIVIPENLKEVKLSMEQRRDVYLIFKEGVNNLVKYSKCKNALVEIKVSKQFELLIRDDGNGFDTMIETSRNGLKNMKNRAGDLNGSLEIISEIGKGTSIELIFII
jgi:two-component sensor histidine kinase